jgi:hypothetical protein
MNKHEERMMDLALEEILGGAAPPDLSERIRLAAPRAAAERPRRAASLVAASIVLAASLLMGALVLWKILSTPNRPPTTHPPASATKRPPQEKPPAPPPGDLERLADELEEASRGGDPDPRVRAEAFLKVEGPRDARSRARFKAALCLRGDALARWEKNPNDPEAEDELRRSEQTLLGVLAIPDEPPARDRIEPLVRYELAVLYLSPAVKQPTKALKLLDLCEKAVPPGDPWLARVWGRQVRAHLNGLDLEPATQLLDKLIDRYPESPEVPRLSKAAAIQIDLAKREWIRKNAEPDFIEKYMRRMARYYAAWINFGPMHEMRITSADVLAVADTLATTARTINHVGPEVRSVWDLRGKTVAEPGFFKDAALVMALGLAAPQAAQERISLGIRRARCLGFAAQDAGGWKAVRDAYLELLKPLKLIQANGTLDPQVLEAHRELLDVYLELGIAHLELGSSANGPRASLDDAVTVFSNLLRVVPAGSEPWWFAKYAVLQAVYQRGGDADLKLSKVGLENLERSWPNFDEGRFGMKARFLDLKQKIDDAMRK